MFENPRDQFIHLVSFNALRNDIKFDKTLCESCIYSAITIPDDILEQAIAESNVHIVAKDWVAHEYGLFQDLDDVTEWIKSYLKRLVTMDRDDYHLANHGFLYELKEYKNL